MSQDEIGRGISSSDKIDEIDKIRCPITTSSLSPRREALLRQVLATEGPIAPSTLERALQVSRPTINRDLRDLLAAGLLEKRGDGRSTRYLATAAAEAVLRVLPSGSQPPVGSGALQWSAAAQPLVEALRAPLGTRTPAGYDSGFVNSYNPNQSSMLPPQLATDLYIAGRSQDQQPAGTYFISPALWWREDQRLATNGVKNKKSPP